MTANRTFGREAVLCVVTALVLISVAVARHPASIQGSGRGLFVTDVALLVLYGMAAAWVGQQQRPKVKAVLGIAGTLGLALGAVYVANHLIEAFVANRPFLVVIVPVLLAFALLGTAGSMAFRLSQSVGLGVVSGIWCAAVAILMLICFAFAFDQVLEQRAEWQLRDAFLASGMEDPGAFLVKNSLEAASEGLMRTPILGFCFSLAGALANAWLSGRTRKAALAFAWALPMLFVAGVASLWYADTLLRNQRPPFVMAGVLLAGAAACSAHPAWSTLRGSSL